MSKTKKDPPQTSKGIVPAIKNEANVLQKDIKREIRNAKIKEFIELGWKADDFNAIIEKDLNFELELVRGTRPKDVVEWDLRITYDSGGASTKNPKNKYPPNWKLSFGNYFIQQHVVYKKITVGTGAPMGTPVFLALFDTDHPHLKNADDNIDLKHNPKIKTMKDLSSNAIGKKFTDFFQLNLPVRLDQTVKFYFIIHKIEIPGLSGGNFVVEHIELKQEPKTNKI